jgi:hypothetical protein
MIKAQRERRKEKQKLKQKRIKDSINDEGYNLTQQLIVSAFICTLSLTSFLPYLLNVDLYDEDPDTPYSGAADEVLLDVTNAVLVACTTMMFLEALLDANTRYLPIKIVFPRFIMVFGVLVVSLSLYFHHSEGMDRLSFMSCMLHAKGYFICGGLMLRLLKDTAAQKSKLCIYALATISLVVDMQLHLWAQYYPQSSSLAFFRTCVSFCTLLVGAYFVFKLIQLSVSKVHDDSGHHSYDLMSHLVICVFLFGTYAVTIYFWSNKISSTVWKDATAEEIAAHNFVALLAIVLFFFTSSHIAQRAFVLAKVSLCCIISVCLSCCLLLCLACCLSYRYFIC